MRRVMAYTLLFVFLATVLVLARNNGLQLTKNSTNVYAIQTSQEDASIGSLVSIFKVAAKEVGWAETLKVLPYLISYSVGGWLGLFVSLFFSIFVLFSMVYLLASKLSTPKIGLLTQLIFALSPILNRYPYDVFSLFSPSLLALIAIYLSLVAIKWRPVLRRLSWVPLSAILLVIHSLTGWGLWPFAFILPIMLNVNMTASRIGILLCVLGLIAAVHTILHAPMLSLYPETPLRNIFFAPNAMQIGYSDIIPKELTFQLPGNNPPLVLLFFASPLLWFSHKPSAFKLMALWLATCIICNFELLLLRPEVGLAFLMFPICFVSAYFFYSDSDSDATIIISVLVFLLYSIVSLSEPTTNLVIVSTKFPGWNTEMPLRDIGQLSGGALVVLIFGYLALKDTAHLRLRQLLAVVILFLFGISQITLIQLLQGL